MTEPAPHFYGAPMSSAGRTHLMLEGAMRGAKPWFDGIKARPAWQRLLAPRTA